jgi:hypothetical protein
MKPTDKQLSYLRALALRAGQTFTPPKTRTDASREINRLRDAEPTSRHQRRDERREIGQASPAATAPTPPSQPARRPRTAQPPAGRNPDRPRGNRTNTGPRLVGGRVPRPLWLGSRAVKPMKTPPCGRVRPVTRSSA